ncbi:MAG: lysophospholipase [Bacillota bacterium]
MYETFTLKETEKGIIKGYEWPLADPVKVVCIVHGLGEYAGRYDRVAGKFNRERIAVVSMDQRGHGDSAGPKGHCAPREEVLRDISELLLYARKQYPGKDIILYGHSMGGNLTLDYRARGEFNDMPVKYLISAPWVRLVNPVSGPLFAFVKFMNKVAPAMAISNAIDETVLGNPEMVLPYVDDPKVHDRISFGCAFDCFSIGEALEKGTHEDNGKTDAIPTMLMHGTADAVCSIEGTRKVYENLKRKGCNVQMIEWPDLFHEIHNGNEVSKGDEVIDSMIQFILG